MICLPHTPYVLYLLFRHGTICLPHVLLQLLHHHHEYSEPLPLARPLLNYFLFFLLRIFVRACFYFPFCVSGLESRLFYFSVLCSNQYWGMTIMFCGLATLGARVLKSCSGCAASNVGTPTLGLERSRFSIHVQVTEISQCYFYCP